MFNGLSTQNKDCGICFEDIDINKIVTTDCNHTFCNKCFFNWIRINSNCPTCRKEFISQSKSKEIQEQRRILDDLVFRQNQIREFIRIGILKYEKKDKEVQALEERKKEMEVKHRLIKKEIEVLKTCLVTEKKKLRNNYKKEWSKLNAKLPWWKNIVHR
jgi:hypothetical protein